MRSYTSGGIFRYISCIIFLTAFLLSACSTSGSPLEDPATLVSPETALTDEYPTLEPSQGDDSSISTPTLAVESLPSEQPTITPIAVRTDLHATDPEGVMLAAGKPQLIEFFAFW
jgi:hypothetical protein